MNHPLIYTRKILLDPCTEKHSNHRNRHISLDNYSQVYLSVLVFSPFSTTPSTCWFVSSITPELLISESKLSTITSSSSTSLKPSSISTSSAKSSFHCSGS